MIVWKMILLFQGARILRFQPFIFRGVVKKMKFWRSFVCPLKLRWNVLACLLKWGPFQAIKQCVCGSSSTTSSLGKGRLAGWVDDMLGSSFFVFAWRFFGHLPNICRTVGGFKSNTFFVNLHLGLIPILTNIFQLGWNHQVTNSN